MRPEPLSCWTAESHHYSASLELSDWMYVGQKAGNIQASGHFGTHVGIQKQAALYRAGVVSARNRILTCRKIAWDTAGLVKHNIFPQSRAGWKTGVLMQNIYCDKTYISNGLVIDKGVSANKIAKCKSRTNKRYTGETWPP